VVLYGSGPPVPLTLEQSLTITLDSADRQTSSASCNSRKEMRAGRRHMPTLEYHEAAQLERNLRFGRGSEPTDTGRFPIHGRGPRRTAR